MPSNAPIVVNDGKSTPVEHTFDPSDLNGSIATFTNYGEAHPPGRETIRVQKSSKSGGAIREVSITMVIPRVVTIDGLASVPDYRTYTLRCLMPASASETELDSDTGMLANLLANANIKKIVERGEWIW